MSGYYSLDGDKLTFDLAKLRAECSLFCATPAFGGQEVSRHSASIDSLIDYFHRVAIRLTVHREENNSLIPLARNRIAAAFLSSGCSHALLVDADVEFPGNEPLRMMAFDLPVLCGMYPRKVLNFEAIWKAAQGKPYPGHEAARNLGAVVPVVVKPGGDRRYGAVEIERGPAGMMMIRRQTFEAVAAHRPDLKFSLGVPELAKLNEFTYAFFQDPYNASGPLGEDYFFCDLVRAAGLKVYADTMGRLIHHGFFPYSCDPAKL